MIFNNSSGAALPDLTDPASPNDVIRGKEYIDGDGEKQTGINGYYKLLCAKNIIQGDGSMIDLVQEDFIGITKMGSSCFATSGTGSRLRSIILPSWMKFDGITNTQNGRFHFYMQNTLVFAIFDNGFSDSIRLYDFDGCSGMKLMIFSPQLSSIANESITTSNIKSYIFLKKGITNIGRAGAFTRKKDIYVPDADNDGNDLVAAYKSATNWSHSEIAPYIHGFSEAPSYDNETEYSVGDVCKYNDKFYAYYKIENSTGNAPSGTAEHTPYWWYCGDCGGVING